MGCLFCAFKAPHPSSIFQWLQPPCLIYSCRRTLNFAPSPLKNVRRTQITVLLLAASFFMAQGLNNLTVCLQIWSIQNKWLYSTVFLKNDSSCWQFLDQREVETCIFPLFHLLWMTCGSFHGVTSIFFLKSCNVLFQPVRQLALMAITEKLHASRAAKVLIVFIVLYHKTILFILMSFGIHCTAWQWSTHSLGVVMSSNRFSYHWYVNDTQPIRSFQHV